MTKAVHVSELSVALAAVYATAARAAPTYSRPTITPGQTTISAIDVAALRAAVLAIW